MSLNSFCDICQTETELQVFIAPKSLERQKQWAKQLGKNVDSSTNICERHFTAKDYTSAHSKRKRLNYNACPSLTLSPIEILKPKVHVAPKIEFCEVKVEDETYVKMLRC